MRWQQYQQLTKEQKEENDYKFKLTDGFHIVYAIAIYNILLMSIISGIAAVTTKNILLAKVSEGFANVAIMIWTIYMIIIFVTLIKQKLWLKKLNLKK